MAYSEKAHQDARFLGKVGVFAGIASFIGAFASIIGYVGHEHSTELKQSLFHEDTLFDEALVGFGLIFFASLVATIVSDRKVNQQFRELEA